MLGSCAVRSDLPDLLTVDGVGYSDIGMLEVPAGSEGQARLGIASCPEGALVIVEETPAAGDS
jgi:ferredoxin